MCVLEVPVKCSVFTGIRYSGIETINPELEWKYESRRVSVFLLFVPSSHIKSERLAKTANDGRGLLCWEEVCPVVTMKWVCRIVLHSWRWSLAASRQDRNHRDQFLSLKEGWICTLSLQSVKQNKLFVDQNSKTNFRVRYYLGDGLSHFLICSHSLLWNVVSASQMEEELISTTFQEMLSIAYQYHLAVTQEDPTVHTRS